MSDERLVDNPDDEGLAGASVIVVDDVSGNRDLLRRLLTRDGYDVRVAADGAAALQMIHEAPPDIVLSDVMMPVMNGLELCRRLKADPSRRLIPVVLITGLSDRESRIEGIRAGADDFLNKPLDAHELSARVRSLLRLKRFTDDLDSAESVILTLAVTVEARDRSTGNHCERMAAFASAFGAHLGLSGTQIGALYRGGFLHDVGKIGIPDDVLLKPGPLTSEERAVMQRHTIIGEALCGNLRVLRPIRPIVRHHHERCDGSGYPDGLAGDAIPLLAQLIAIVDVYDALTSNRVYRAATTSGAALSELRAEAKRGWHRADLVDAFGELVARGGTAANLLAPPVRLVLPPVVP